MVALALNTGLLPLTKRATTAKKTVRRTVAPKVRRSLLFLASTLSSRDERTNGWMDGCAQPLPSARSVFFFNAVDTPDAARRRVRVSASIPRRGYRRASVRVVVSLRSRRRPRVGAREGNETTTTTTPGRSTDRSIDRSSRSDDANERCERCERTTWTNDADERTTERAPSIDRTDARTHGRADARTEPSSSFVRVVRITHPHHPSGPVESSHRSRVGTHGDGTT